VREALINAEITRITVSRATGHGRQMGEEFYRGQAFAPNLIPKVRLDIACNDEFVEITCNAIISAVKKGGSKIGDGKIFITPLRNASASGQVKGGGALYNAPGHLSAARTFFLFRFHCNEQQNFLPC